MGNPRLAYLPLVLAAALTANAQARTPNKPASQDKAAVGYFTDGQQLKPDFSKEKGPLPRIHFAPQKVTQATPTLVDLHNHAFMEHGLGMLFQGGFNEPLAADSWTDRFSSQINDATLNTSGLGVAVVALYVHPIFNLSLRDSIRAQLKAAKEFVAHNPQWVIVKSAEEARKAHLSGKRLLVFSLEGASGVLESEEDYEEFIDKEGIRIVTFAHLADDHLTGAAFMPGIKRMATPWAAIGSVFNPKHNAEGTLVNPNGLSAKGREVAQALINRGVWIDLTHAPEASQKELIPMMRAAGQPLLYTHTGLRKYRNAERVISLLQVKRVADTGGIVGIAPSKEMIGETKVDQSVCPAHCNQSCKSIFYKFATQYREMASYLGPRAVYVGSDFNGALDHIAPPTDCPTGTSIDRPGGFYHIGQTSELWHALKRSVPEAAETAYNGALNFIDTWSKVLPVKGQ